MSPSWSDNAGSPAANHYLDGMQTYHHVRNRVCDGFLGDEVYDERERERERERESVDVRENSRYEGAGDKAPGPVYWHTNGR